MQEDAETVDVGRRSPSGEKSTAATMLMSVEFREMERKRSRRSCRWLGQRARRERAELVSWLREPNPGNAISAAVSMSARMKKEMRTLDERIQPNTLLWPPERKLTWLAIRLRNPPALGTCLYTQRSNRPFSPPIFSTPHLPFNLANPRPIPPLSLPPPSLPLLFANQLWK